MKRLGRELLLAVAVVTMLGCPHAWHKDYGTIHRAIRKDLDEAHMPKWDEDLEEYICPKGQMLYEECRDGTCEASCK